MYKYHIMCQLKHFGKTKAYIFVNNKKKLAFVDIIYIRTKKKKYIYYVHAIK